MKKILKNNSLINRGIRFLPYLIVAFTAVSSTFLWSENPYRALFLITISLIWVLLTRLHRSFTLPSLLLLLFCFPFNVTLSLLNTNDPYINGVFTNFLVPTISVLDILSLLFISSVLSDYGARKTLPSFVYIVLALLSLHLVLHPSLISLLQTSRYMVYIIAVYMGVKFVKENQNTVLSPLITTLLITVVIQVVIALFQVLLGRDLGLQMIGESKLLAGSIGSSFIEFESGVVLRGYGTFPHPNLLSTFFLITTTFALYLLRGSIFLRFLIILISLIGIILTFSRVGLVLILLILIIYLTTIAFRKGERVGGKKLIMSINPLLLYLSPVLTRFASIFALSDSSAVERVSLAKHSLWVIDRYMFKGVGIGNYVSTMKDSVVYTTNGLLLLQPVHNIFLLAVAEMGIIGIIFSIFVFYRVLVVNYSRFSIPLYLSLLVMIIVIGMFDHFFLTLPQGIVMFLILLLI